MSTGLVVVFQDRKTGRRFVEKFRMSPGGSVRKMLAAIRKSTGAKIVKYTLVS